MKKMSDCSICYRDVSKEIPFDTSRIIYQDTASYKKIQQWLDHASESSYHACKRDLGFARQKQ